MSFKGWVLDLSLSSKLGIAVFTFTVSAYVVLFYLGRKWRREFKAMGITYWGSQKEIRIQELMDEVWEPGKITFLYGLSYFTNGFVRSTFSLWVPIFLLDEIGVTTAEASLFVGLMYISWSWKMFIGLIADLFPIKWRNRYYKRKPWFVITGILYLLGIVIMFISDFENASIWKVLFPAVVSIITAGAFYDMAADSLAIDVTPPEYHARVIGGVSTAGQSIGSAMATILPLFLLKIGGYKMIFTLAGVTGLTAFLFLSVKEPEFAKERLLSKEAIAFTFTEFTVILAVMIMFSRSFTVMKITAPLGGMFSFTVREVVGADISLVSTLGLVATLAGLPGSWVGGIISDKYGHKKAFTVASILFTCAGFLWTTIAPGAITWFIIVAMISAFLERFWTGTTFAIMADSTPLAMSSTVYQMYMSWSWIGNIPSSIMIGYLLGFSLRSTALVTSSLMIVPLILGTLIKPFDAGKATEI
ncbi:MFS transporter [Thermoproteota archaeon]